MRIRKDLPIPHRSKYDFLRHLVPGDCLCFDAWSDFERHRDAMRYMKIKHTTQKYHTNHELEYRIWIKE